MFTEIENNQELDALAIDLSDLEIEDIEVLMQEGSTGMPDFAASSGGTCIDAGSSSCSVSD